MFAYFIIACELAILYTVFWYIFLREPKPYKIVGDPWGTYEGKNDDLYILAERLPQAVNHSHEGYMQSGYVPPGHFQSGNSQAAYWQSGYSPTPSYEPRRAPARRHQESSCQCPHTAPQNPSMRYGWVVAEQPKPGTLARLLFSLGRKIEGLNPRLP